METHFELPPLILGVKNSLWRVHDADREDADAAFRSVRYQVTQRDKLTCQYCGMQSAKISDAEKGTSRTSGYLEVHHKDDDHANNVPDNLVTICPFCHAVFHCGNAGHRKVGHIISAPWILQEDLNILCHMMFLVMHASKQAGCDEETLALGEEANVRYGLMEGLREDACAEFGEGMDDPENFGYALMTLANEAPEAYLKRESFLGGARFLPSYNAHAVQIRMWFLANKAMTARGMYREYYRNWQLRYEEWTEKEMANV